MERDVWVRMKDVVSNLPNINISKPTLCSFITVRMRYVDVMM